MHQLTSITVSGDHYKRDKTDSYWLPIEADETLRYLACYEPGQDMNHTDAYPYVTPIMRRDIVLDDYQKPVGLEKAVVVRPTATSALAAARCYARIRGWRDSTAPLTATNFLKQALSAWIETQYDQEQRDEEAECRELTHLRMLLKQLGFETLNGSSYVEIFQNGIRVQVGSTLFKVVMINEQPTLAVALKTDNAWQPVHNLIEIGELISNDSLLKAVSIYDHIENKLFPPLTLD